jgi:hypothetical protein
MICRILAGALAALVTLSTAVPAWAAEHWAIGEWAGKLGSGDVFLEIRQVASDGKARGGVGSQSPVGVDNPAISISVVGNTVTVAYEASTQVIKLTRQGSDLVGTFTNTQGTATRMVLKLKENYDQYVGQLYIRGGCTGGAGLHASVIIEGKAIRGAIYSKGYTPEYFAGEMNGDSFQTKTGSPSHLEVFVKRKRDSVGLEVKGPSSTPQFSCPFYSDLDLVKREAKVPPPAAAAATSPPPQAAASTPVPTLAPAPAAPPATAAVAAPKVQPPPKAPTLAELAAYSGVFDRAQVPVARSAVMETALKRYSEAAGPKALAIGPDAKTVYQYSRQSSTDEAKRRVLQYCEWKEGPGCSLYAVDNEALAASLRVPEDRFKIRYDQSPGDPTVIPFVGDAMRERIANSIRTRGNRHSVVAIHPDGAASWKRNETEEVAREEALESCKQLVKTDCFLYAVNDKVVLAPPKR